jgi:hypothetical protein
MWYGALEDEPASPDGTAFNQSRNITGAIPGALGWMMTQFGDPNEEQRIAFLSFTGDPTIVATPETTALPGTLWTP